MKLFWIFILGSFFGYVVETIYAFIKSGGHFVIRQGLLYGPFYTGIWFGSNGILYFTS